MSRIYYEEDYGQNIPDHHSNQPRPNMQSRIPRPDHAAQDRMRPPRQMNVDPYHNPTQPGPRRTPEAYYPEQSTRAASQHLYDGSGYDDEYGQYDQYDQWPLPSPIHGRSPRSSPRRPPSRPQRPQRADDLPSRSAYRPNAPVRQQHSPSPMSHHGSGEWTGDGYAYAPPDHPPPNRPLPQSRGQSSSPSPIPQYAPPHMPLPVAQGHTNRRQPLGPPPSARRGPSSYYTPIAPVHPIVEETDSMRGSSRAGSAHTGSVRAAANDSKTSFASSNAIPIGIPQYYLEDDDSRPSTGHQYPAREDFDEESSIEAASAQRLGEFVDPHAGLEGPPSPEVLVRQASLGKKSKPTLTTVKSGDKLRKASPRNTSIEATTRPENKRQAVDVAHVYGMPIEGPAGAGASADEPASDRRDGLPAREAPGYSGQTSSAQLDSHGRTPEDVLRSGTGLIDPDSSDDDVPGEKLNVMKPRDSLRASHVDVRDPEKVLLDSRVDMGEEDRVKAILNNLEKGGAISKQEVGGLKAPSPGFSERAERKRPPRLNVDAVREAEARGSLTSLPDLIRRATKLASNLDRGKTASRMGFANWLDGADMAEKRRSGSVSDILNSFPAPNGTTPRASRPDMSRWSSRLRHSALPSDSDTGEKPKTPRKCCGMPLWLFFLVLLLLLLLVAAAVVVPVMLLVVVPNQNNHHERSANSCEKALTCQNGGTNIISGAGFCECLCINGYTGTTCTEHELQGCTTTSIGPSNNATVGDAIPRLLEDSSGNFSIPLDGQQLLGLFSSSDLSCMSQNALVTFNGAANKRRSFVDVAIREDSASMHVQRQASTTPSPASNNQTTLDFARVAVLYVFQASGALDTAAQAQQDLQTWFNSGDSSAGQSIPAANVQLGNGFSCDLTAYSMHLPNGTTIGT